MSTTVADSIAGVVILTHRSSATISSMSSGTTVGPSEMHTDSTHLSSPNGDFRRLTSRSRGRPAHPSVRICGLLVAFHVAATPHAQRN
jgi:hypothetical protein